MIDVDKPTPAEAAYTRLYGPVTTGHHLCGRCARRVNSTVALGEVVSKKYTGFDDWATPGGDLCPVCAWALQPGFRSKPVVIRTDGIIDEIDREDLADILSRPVRDLAVVIPLRPGRKHLLPSATWAHVTVDDATVRWGPDEVEFRNQMAWLRSCGLSVAMIAGGAPDIGVLRALPTRELQPLLRALSLVRSWRHRPQWDIGVRASTADSTRRQ